MRTVPSAMSALLLEPTLSGSPRNSDDTTQAVRRGRSDDLYGECPAQLVCALLLDYMNDENVAQPHYI